MTTTVAVAAPIETPTQRITAMPLPDQPIDVDQVGQSFIEQALARFGGNQSKAARFLGISRYALRYRVGK